MYRGGGNARITSHNHCLWQVGVFNNLALWGENKFVSELKRAYKFQRGVNNILDCHANQTRILSKEYSFVAGDYVRSTARNDVKRHTEDNSPKYRMVCNDVGLKSPTHRSFKFWYRDFCSSLRANAKQSRKTVITRSDKRRSNLIHIEKDEIATFRYTPLAMTSKRLRNKCAIVCDLFPRPFGERVRERGYLAASLLSRLAAFTLAEVLITLGIIGVVAAMTMPALIQNYQEKVLANQFKKSYSMFSQVLNQVWVDNDMSVPSCYYNQHLTSYDFSACNEVSAAVLKKLNVVKTCEKKSYENGCIPKYSGLKQSYLQGFTQDWI